MYNLYSTYFIRSHIFIIKSIYFSQNQFKQANIVLSLYIQKYMMTYNLLNNLYYVLCFLVPIIIKLFYNVMQLTIFRILGVLQTNVY